MEKTNSAGTTGTEECMDDGGDERLIPCPEVESANGRVPDWKEIMEAMGTEDLIIFKGYSFRVIQIAGRVNGRGMEMPDLGKHIMGALGDPDIHMIGVCGKDGRYMDHLFDTIIRRVERDDLFDMIVMEIMENKSNLKEIQHKIACQLGLSYQEQEKRILSLGFFTHKKKDVIIENAKQLSDRIRSQPKILFILRNLNSTLDLAKLGIPIGVDHIGCKLILTSESEEILSKMNVQRTERGLGLFCPSFTKRMPSLGFFTYKKKEVITEKAKQLSDRIRAQPKILFIIRDLRTTLDLVKLGIPLDVDHIGCKLILTSESEEILSKMNVQRTYAA